MTAALTFDDGTEIETDDSIVATVKIDGDMTDVELDVLGDYRDADNKLVVGQDGQRLGDITNDDPIRCRDEDCIGYITQVNGDTLYLFGVEEVEN